MSGPAALRTPQLPMGSMDPAAHPGGHRGLDDCHGPLVFLSGPGHVGGAATSLGEWVFSHTSSFPANALLLFVARHPKVLSLGSALCGAALGILGFPGGRAAKDISEAAVAQMEKSDSME